MMKSIEILKPFFVLVLFMVLGASTFAQAPNADKWVEVNGEQRYPSLKMAKAHPEKIHSLTVYYPKVKRFPSELLRFTSVDTMVLFLCSVPKLPDELSYFKKLRHLEIWHPASPDLPKEIGELTRLESLTIVRKGELTFPVEWTHLVNLKKLKFVDANVLFPDEMYRLKNLEELYLINSALHVMPAWIRGLKSLKGLLIVNDKELAVPKELQDNPDLRVVVKVNPKKEKKAE